MKRNIMEPLKSIQRTAKFAGCLFLFNLLIPTLGYVLVQSKLFVANNPILTSNQIIANEKMFRFGLLSAIESPPIKPVSAG